ncbi:vWA-like protein, partial [Aspergillus steynii IBT 23096]
PLLSVSIDAKLDGNISTTIITQKYRNPSLSPAEHTKYLFPIYDGSAVTSFKCWIGPDKLLEGAVKPKQQARKEFAEAVSKHKAAVLVEELTPEIFETNLGNIPGETDVTVQITLATRLKSNQTTGATTLTIPTSVAPRYGDRPKGYDQPDTAGKEATATQDALHIKVHVSMPESIKKIESQTHLISVDLGSEAGAFDPRKASASLVGRSAALGKDFVLTILSDSKELKVSRALAVPQPDSQKATIALTLSPGDLFRKKFRTHDFTGEVIFIVDRSGSMRGKMPALRDVMNVFVRSLPEHCSFNIVSFGTHYSWLWETSQQYSEATLEKADSDIAGFSANYGGTGVLKVLESIPMHFNKQANVPTNVIVLTDGETWDVENVIKFVREMASTPENNIRFFALGIGDEVSHRLVNGIGVQGGGCAEVINDTRSSLVWQGSVIQMLKNALTPSRLRCSISFAGLMQNGVKGIQAPHTIPPLNAFSQHSVYYMLENGVEELPDTLTVTATTDDDMILSTELPIHRSDTQSIHHLAAKAFIEDYETGHSWLHAEHSALQATDQDAFNRMLEHEAQQLGVKWSIPSKWTSYVAVDRSSQQEHESSLAPAERDE